MSDETADDESPESVAFSPQEALTITRLSEDYAKPFLTALIKALTRRLGWKDISSADEFVRRVRDCATERIVKLFFALRDALDDVQKEPSHAASIARIEEAAMTCFLLAASRLVDKTEAEPASAVQRIELCAELVCAIIAGALFERELHLDPSEKPGEPCARHYHEITVPAGGDQPAFDFERAVFTALFPIPKSTSETAQEGGPLTLKERGRLKARIVTLIEGDQQNVTLLARGLDHGNAYEAFAASYRVPIFLPTHDLATRIRGMDPDELYGHICEFWANCLSRQPPAPAPGRSPEPNQSTGVQQAVPKEPSRTVNVYGTYNHNEGDSNVNTNLVNQEGAPDLAALLPILQALLQQLKTYDMLADQREQLTKHVQTARAEAGKKKPDLSIIEKALDRLRSGAAMLSEGEKIMKSFKDAYNMVAPSLNLPPLP